MLVVLYFYYDISKHRFDERQSSSACPGQERKQKDRT